MIKPQTTSIEGAMTAGRAASGEPAHPAATPQGESRRRLLHHRAETERLRVLVEFVSKPVHAHGGAEPDPDIVTAYNLAVEAALRGIRRGAMADDLA